MKLYKQVFYKSNIFDMAELKFVFVLFSVVLPASVSAYYNLNNVLFSGQFEFIDLTHPFDKNTVYFPGGLNFTFIKELDRYVFGYVAKEFAAAEHGGTHIDAPFHFSSTGRYVGELPIEDLIVPMTIVDVSCITNDNPEFILTRRYLDDSMIKCDARKPCLIIFKFGWSKYFSDANKYLGTTDGKTLSFPGVGPDVVQWIVTSYPNVVGIGVDGPSLDAGSNIPAAPSHVIGAKYGLYNIENVNLFRSIPECGCTALVLPMKIALGTGAPLRLVAICPKQESNRRLRPTCGF